MNEMTELSFNEKIALAHSLANDLTDLYNADRLIDLDEGDVDLIFGHADGLSAKRLYDIRDGRCSFETLMNFDFEKEEALMDSHIEYFKELLENRK